MLWFCAGTAGELIKVYPLLRMATERKLSWFMLSTGQSGINFFRQWDDFLLPRERVGTLVQTTADLHTSQAAVHWFSRAALTSTSDLRKTVFTLSGQLPTASDTWLVHGDTLSTLIGSWYARRLKVPLAHIEAGLRSDRLFHPFPEEINRRWVSRLAQLHFPQDTRALENLNRARFPAISGRKICTEGNTLIDAIHYMNDDFRKAGTAATLTASGDAVAPYVVANVHRFENLHSPENWETILQVLERAAKKHRVKLVLHPPTQEKLAKEPGARARLEKAGIELLPRQPFRSFIQLLIGSEYVISDGGSNQEECHYLGKPCLLLRNSTERIEGLNGPCLLTKFQKHAIDRFFAEPGKFKGPEVFFPRSPSSIILDSL
ncbi:MAG: UDP-N-acetylglucosamine 2-epimerase [Methylotenera sp.]|nr:UDP-N-acetylglucosamine 2-epimerase [Oligoflexia bacterium]